MSTIRAQELCEGGCGRPGIGIPDSLCSLYGCKKKKIVPGGPADNILYYVQASSVGSLLRGIHVLIFTLIELPVSVETISSFSFCFCMFYKVMKFVFQYVTYMAVYLYKL